MRNLRMQYALGAAIAAAAMLAAGAVRAAEPTAVGLWQIVEDGKVEGWALFVDRGGVVEGGLVKIFPEPGKPLTADVCTKCKDDRKDQPVLGISFIRDMKREGLVYEGGNILDPKTGSVWKAKMTLSPDGQTLVLRGYLGFSMLGQNRTWQRLPDTAFAQLDPSVSAKYLPPPAPVAPRAPVVAKMKSPPTAPATPPAPATR